MAFLSNGARTPLSRSLRAATSTVLKRSNISPAFGSTASIKSQAAASAMQTPSRPLSELPWYARQALLSDWASFCRTGPKSSLAALRGKVDVARTYGLDLSSLTISIVLVDFGADSDVIASPADGSCKGEVGAAAGAGPGFDPAIGRAV